MDSKYFEALYPEDTRFTEIEQILSFVKEGNSCQIIGLPGVGRANLLRYLAYNKALRLKHLGDLAQWMHFVAIDFSEIRNRTLFDVTKYIFLSLTDSLRERGKEEEYLFINTIFKESLSFQDELVLFQGLKRVIDYLALEKELTIVLLCDRFEEYIPSLTSEFFANLRVLRNRAKYRFSVIMSLPRPLEEMIEPALLTDFYEFIAGHTVYLPLYDKPSNTFRLSYLEKVTEKTLSSEILSAITDLTGGHGRLTRLCTEVALLNTVSGNQLEQTLLQEKTVQGALRDIWNALLPSEQQWLLAGDTKLTDHTLATEYLTKVGLLKGGKVQIPLFAAFLESERTHTSQQADHITYDIHTNTILKGELDLTERLTAAEYRLLTYLLEHAEQIVGRQQIVDVVWQEAASTAGVTDQAVDQLVFRLRKKIEDDPNAPTHLQTIKGRGFKFSP